MILYLLFVLPMLEGPVVAIEVDAIGECPELSVEGVTVVTILLVVVSLPIVVVSEMFKNTSCANIMYRALVYPS